MKLPTLDGFLAEQWPPNSYIKHPEFDQLYLRKGTIGVHIDGKFWFCRHTLTIARIVAGKPGKGAFSRLIEDLAKRKVAICVEIVHEERFQNKLLSMGFVKATPEGQTPSFLLNFVGHLADEPPKDLRWNTHWD